MPVFLISSGDDLLNSFFNSQYMLYLLAALLLLVFFLPDIIGPLPSLLIGSVVIGFAFYVYSRWSREHEDAPDKGDQDLKEDTKEH